MTAERFVTSWNIDCRCVGLMSWLRITRVFTCYGALPLMPASIPRKEVNLEKCSSPPGADSIRSCSIRAKRLQSQVVAYRLRPRNKTKLEYIRHLIAQKRIVYRRRATVFFGFFYQKLLNDRKLPNKHFFNVFFPFSFQNETSGKWLSTLNCRPTHRKKGKRVAQSSQ